jgi:hypothetical protein
MFNPPPFGEALNHKKMEEMREVSNKTITAEAAANAERYDTRYKKVAAQAFAEGARWVAAQIAAGMKAVEEGY